MNTPHPFNTHPNPLTYASRQHLAISWVKAWLFAMLPGPDHAPVTLLNPAHPVCRYRRKLDEAARQQQMQLFF